MAKFRCPTCRSLIASADLNLEKGMSLCRVCDQLRDVDDLLVVPFATVEEIANPPKGCRIREDAGGFVVVGSTRNLRQAVPYGLFGSIFMVVVGSAAADPLLALVTILFGPIAGLAPSSNWQGQGLGAAIIPLVILCPFLLACLYLLSQCVLQAFGEVRVELSRGHGAAFTGVGRVGWTKHFDAAAVRAVRFGETRMLENGVPLPLIIIEAERTLKFGRRLPLDRWKWMTNVIGTKLLPGEPDTSSDRV